MENEYNPAHKNSMNYKFVEYEKIRLDLKVAEDNILDSEKKFKENLVELNKFYRESYIKYN